MHDERGGIQRRGMPAGHGRGDDEAIDIRGFQPRDILCAGYGRFLYHIEEMGLPYPEFARSPADDYGVLFLCHTYISFYLKYTYTFLGIRN
jgi:hypothetical protein